MFTDKLGGARAEGGGDNTLPSETENYSYTWEICFLLIPSIVYVHRVYFTFNLFQSDMHRLSAGVTHT